MQCVILAGGLGTRMQGVAKGLPKSLIPIKGHPFLHYQLSWLARAGVTEVVLCVGYAGDRIKEFAGNGDAWKLRIRYADEGKHLRGTGGALRLAHDEGLLAPSFLVTYGDSFLPIDFSSVWTYFQTRPEPALMAVLKNERRWDKSNADFDGSRVTRYDKKAPSGDMNYIDFGLNVLRASTVEKEVPKDGAYDLAELFHKLSLRGDLAGFEVQERFYEVGSVAGLKDFESYINRHPGRP